MQTIADHVARALGHLLSQYQGKPRFEAFAGSFIGDVQELEDACWTVAPLLDIDGVSGIYLDRIGRIVGQARSGEGDEEYRRLLRARIAANRSAGLAKDVARVARMAFYGLGPSVEHFRDRTIIVELATPPVGSLAAAADLVGDAAPAGRSVHIHFPLVNEPVFTLAEGDDATVDAASGLAGDAGLPTFGDEGGRLIDVLVGA